MKASFSASPAGIEARAREWFVRLQDDAIEPDEVLALEHWLEADSRHRAAYEQVEEAWRLMLLAPDVLAPTAKDLAEDRYAPNMPVAGWRRAQRGRLRLISALAVLLLAALPAAGIGWLWFSGRTVTPQQFATDRARYLEARLEDGSHVRLGGMTTLKVAFSPRQRSVGMEAGEALFQVAHDRARPFVVHTPLAAITAVGTAFDVDVEASGVVLTVTEGVVSVVPDTGGDPVREDPAARSAIQVRQGQQLKMERDGARLVLALGEGGSAASWTDGRLEYRNAALRSVIEDVNRYTSKPIIIADAGLANLQYTGTVELRSADSWVLGLPAAFPLTVELNDRGEFILRQKIRASLPAAAPSSSATTDRRDRPTAPLA